jgi:pilus assembly protein Flp/PilA
MTGLQDCVRRFFTDESGATAIEYSIIAAGIAVVIVLSVNAIGNSVKSKFESVSSGFN